MPTDLPLFFDQLVRFQIELWNAVDARLSADCGLSLGRFQTLRVIDGRSGCRVQDIAQDLAITVGGVSKVVDRLVASGHCVRSANPDDKRSSLITLTPVGEQGLAVGTASFEDELRERVGSVLPAAVVEEMTSGLTELRAAMPARPAMSAAEVPS
jgi:DNA-binding MarR family transcriptional regulator